MTDKIVYFIYDGECPICSLGASFYRLKQNIGELQVIDARIEQNTPLMQEINNAGHNLDDGMVIKYNGRLYQGDEALHLMAVLGSKKGLLNFINNTIYKSKFLAKHTYPFMRAARNLALKIKGVGKINNLIDKNIPTFKPVFGKDWGELPPVMLKHYANRPYSNDISTVEGELDVMCKWYIQLFFRVLGTIPAYNEKNVPVTVNFTSNPNNAGFGFERIFHFKNHKPFHFHSRMYQVSGSEVMERMKYGLCWHSNYSWDGQKVILAHKGYSLRIFSINIPLPITWLIGGGDAYEIPVDDNTFDMCVNITHPLLGNVYEYKGQFKVTREV